MKTNYSIRKLLSLIVVFFVINSCLKDDSVTPCDTFLEYHEGTVWIDQTSYTDEITYIRFINDVEIIIEVFNKFIPANMDCYNNYYICQSWGELSIVENTVKKIEFIISPPDYELNTVEFIFIKSNDSLNLTFNIYDDFGELIKSTKSILNKSTINVDELPICNVN